MCRMMAIVGPCASATALVARFREEARGGRVARGAAPGHTDGWGVAFLDAVGTLRHAGRSTGDASQDAGYPEALARLDHAAPGGVILAHVRKASRGSVVLENTHPFIEDGLAFCHNGTVDGVSGPGENDSRALFARLLAERRKGASVEDAMTTLARDVDARCVYTSLTLLVTDGHAVWGLRRVGNDPLHCAPAACAADYYTLGVARLPEGGVVVSQEHEILGLDGWRPVGDGELVHVSPEGIVTTRRILPSQGAEAETV